MLFYTYRRGNTKTIPARYAAAHKGTKDMLLLIAGSYGKIGAAVLQQSSY
jgi:NAD(P)H-hydrate repair Nnr-like enzyme with NAD(P)H-hydrate dehydratase domain